MRETCTKTKVRTKGAKNKKPPANKYRRSFLRPLSCCRQLKESIVSHILLLYCDLFYGLLCGKFRYKIKIDTAYKELRSMPMRKPKLVRCWELRAVIKSTLITLKIFSMPTSISR